MDLLFNIFIYPIEWLMHTILEGVFLLTSNYGVSIIILSTAINILILPLYYLAEHLKAQHQAQLGDLQPKIDLLKSGYKGQERHMYLQALYKIYNYHPLSSVKASLGLLLQIPFFFAAFHFLGNYPEFNAVSFGVISDLSKSDNLLFGQNLLPILMTLINVFSAYYYANNISNSGKYQLWGLSVIFLVLLYFESSALLLYWTINNLFSLAKNWVEEKFDITKFKQTSVNLLVFPAKAIIQNKITRFLIRDAFAQSVILLFGIIFIYQAISIAASDTGMYSAEYSQVVLYLIGFFVVSIAIALGIYYFLSRKWRHLFIILASFGALSGLFFAFIMPMEIEQIASLSFPSFFIPESIIIKIIKLLLVAFLFVVWFFIFKKIRKAVWIVLLLSNIFLAAQTISAGLNPKEIDVLISINKTNMSVDQAKRFYEFSKKSNTIVIMMDSFQGGMFADIIEKHSEIKKDFSGFVYYPNTLAHGSNTWLSMGSIVAGEEFQVHRVEGQSDYQEVKKNIQQEIKKNIQKVSYIPKNASYLRNMAIAKKYHHSYSVFEPDHVECDIFNSYEDAICLRSVVIDKKLAKRRDEVLATLGNSRFEVAKFFAQLSFLLSTPHEVKGRLAALFYNPSISDFYLAKASSYSQLKNMSNFSNTEGDKKTFKLIANDLVHSPWMINDSCQLVNQEFKGYQGAFDSDYCAVQLLSQFFDKLKQLSVYDKTKIIIIADHGHRIKVDTKSKNPYKRRSSALMLVKDFNKSGDLQTSMQFMSTMDTYGIALSGVSEDKEIEFDKIKTPENNRSLVFVRETTPPVSYNITKAFKVKNNIFDANNWQELTKEQIQQLSQ